MILSVTGSILNFYTPRYEGKELIIGIDSSKSNSAMAVADSSGELIEYIELNGKNAGTSEQDTLRLCKEQRDALSIIFKNSKPKIIGIENIISKNYGNEGTGMTVHLSRFKITAVFMSFISFFQDEFGVTPQLVNNQTWKSTVLPAEYCKREYHKGSLEYFKSINSKFQYCSDDVTDAICIMRYLCIVNKVKKGFAIAAPEVARYEFKYIYASYDRVISGDEKVFFINNEITLHQNMIVMANQLQGKQVAVAEVEVNKLELNDIYEHARGKFDKVASKVKLVVQRV